MSPARLACLAALCGALSAPAQLSSVKVYSGFQRIDPFGNVVSMDRARREGVRPREILSPAIGRNSHVVFHVAVTVAPGQDFSLWIGQNPDNYLGVSMYREIYAQHGGQWIPDALERVELPISGRLPASGQAIPGQTTLTYLMDVFAGPGVEVGRSKLEPELNVDGQWIIYPMEVRVVPAVAPEYKLMEVPLAPLSEPADATARSAVRAYLCGPGKPETPAAGTLRWFLLRDVSQDLALARSRETSPGSRLLPVISPGSGAAGAGKWCQSPTWPEELGPEWYLRVRDSLYRED
ncbi:MAG: hypothetical protein IT159_11770 [Bryobacterales bacterium]|nr:hypothetical protein [Bryobacterales bacterium]